MKFARKRPFRLAAAIVSAICVLSLVFLTVVTEREGSPRGNQSACQRVNVAPVHWRTDGRIQAPVALDIGGHRTKIAEITMNGRWEMEFRKVKRSSLISVKGGAHVRYRPLRLAGKAPYRIQVFVSFVVDWRASTDRELETGATSYGTSRLGYHWAASDVQNGNQVESIGQLARNSGQLAFAINDSMGGRSRPIRIQGRVPEDAWMKVGYVVELPWGGSLAGGIWGSPDYNWRCGSLAQ